MGEWGRILVEGSDLLREMSPAEQGPRTATLGYRLSASQVG